MVSKLFIIVNRNMTHNSSKSDCHNMSECRA